MNLRNKYSIITILIFAILLINYTFAEKNIKESKILLRCKKKCNHNNKKLKKFCKKCSSLNILDKNKIHENDKISENNEIFENNKTSENNILSEKKNFSVTLLSYSTNFDYNKIENLFVFGDSYSSVNTNFLDMSYTGDNRSLGKNWPLKLIELKNMKLWDFAIPASTINKNIVKSDHDFFDQYNHFFEKMTFNKYFNGEWKSSNSLFAIWIGSEDIIRIPEKSNIEKLSEQIISNMFDVIEKLYNDGARNFLILNIFYLNKTPYNKSGKINYMNFNINYYNKILKNKLNYYFKTKNDLNIFFYDINYLIDGIIEHCYNYEFNNCKDAWVLNKDKNVEDFFWSDLTHTTYKANSIFSEKINEFLKIDKISENKNSSKLLLSNSTKFNYNEIENLIVFGDSHSFTGTDFETMKFSEAILSNRRNWPLRLSDIHNMTLWNFATNGAVVSQNITYRVNYPIDFIKQYELFYERMSNGKKYFSKWSCNNTLFTIYMGSNDIFDVHWVNNNKTINENLNDIVDILFDKLENAYNIGIRNYLIMNLSPFDKAPINANQKYKYIKSDILFFNSLLVKKAEYLFNKYKNINIIIYDTNKEYNYIINHYKDYNFKSGIEAWSPSHRGDLLDNYFWRDFTHISNKANKILAEDINDFLNSINN